jgi:hypothetical protein
MSRTWFALAVAAVLGLFYVGSGLRGHATPAIGLAYGQEVKVKPLFEQPAEPVAMKWQTLSASGRPGSQNAYRSKVPGGWLVETSRSTQNGIGVGLAFVPDPNHEWNGGSLP